MQKRKKQVRMNQVMFVFSIFLFILASLYDFLEALYFFTPLFKFAVNYDSS